ncbi:YadA-like family protein [Bosea sp. 685]|nr:YadA-like family protein [Bosea sp. 685]WNJ93558.1 YadA-like family protein [Bosea sp. 685]
MTASGLVTDCTDRRTQAGFRGGFTGNWVSGGGESRSLRRRLMAVLRMAHRVLGVSRKGLGLGSLGVGGALAVPLVALGGIGWVSPAQAQAVSCAASPYNAYNGTASCMGLSATASGTGATALGSLAAADVLGGLAVGYNAHSAAQNGIALGFQANAAAINSIYLGARTAAGTGALAAGAIGIGTDVTASQANALAIGTVATASGVQSVALGYSAAATSNAATAVGNGAQAQGQSSLALGTQAIAVGSSTVAVGQGAGVGSTTGNSSSVAMGVAAGALVSGAQNTAIGGGIPSVMRGAGSGVTGARNLALGTGDGTVTYDGTLQASAGSLVTGSDNVAIGTNAGIGVTSNATTSIGQNAKAAGTNAAAIGAGATASGLNSVYLGARTGVGTGALAQGAIAIGTDVTASQTDAMAMGRASRATALNSTAVGVQANASGNFAIALGNAAVSSGTGSVAAGSGAQSTGVSSVALGNNTVASVARATALGVSSSAGAQSALAIGDTANASAQNAIAAGTGAVANSADSVAMGTGATAGGGKAVAIGAGNVAYGNGAVAIGDPSYASGTGAFTGGANNIANADGTASATAANQANGAVAIGNGNTAIGQGSVAIGNTSRAGATGAVAFGDAAIATNARDVALGSGSVTAVAVGTSSAVVNGTTYNFAGTTPGSTVSVGAVGAERTITNVAAGRISGSSTDAINGSQLFATNQAVDSIGATVTNINTGGGIKYFHANSALPDSQALGTNSVAIGPNAVANNAGDIALGLGSITGAAVGTSSIAINGTTYNFTGTTPGSTVSVGAVGAERTITNVAAGRINGSSTDAVNGSQLFATNQAVDSIGATVTNINTGGGIKYFHANSTLPDSQALGTNSVAIGPNAVANNAGDIALGLGSVTDTAVGTASVVINGTTYNFAGTTPGSTVSVGAVGAERSITNVAAGRISGSSTDAVNGSQLFATNQAVDSLASSVTNINTGGGIKYFHANSTLPDSQALGTNSVAIGPNAVATNTGDVAIGLNSVSGTTTAVAGATIGGTAYSFAGATPAGAFSVGSAGAERQIQNVAAGQLSSASTDAVNGSQLFATNQQVTVNTTDIATLGTTVNNIAGNVSTAYTDANGDGIRYVRTNDRTLAITDSFAQGIAATAVGYQATAVADNSLALGRDSQATILGGVALGSGSISDRALAPITGTLPAGSAIIQYNTTDKTLLGAVSVGTATSYRQITNVADGTQSQDAVTIRQLQGAIASVATTPTLYFHANSTGLDSLSVGAESIAVGPRTVVNGDNGIGIGNGAIVEQTAPGGTAIGQNAHVVLADGVALGTNATAGGIQSMALGAGATSNFANSVALGGNSATQATVATASTTIRGTTYNFAGAAPVGTVSIGDVGAERTLTNLAAGRLSATSTDAINGSQLYATNMALESVQGGIGAINNSAVFYDLNIDGSKKNSLTLQGGDPNAPVVISNVAEGVKGTDAVNVNQLNRGVAEAKAYTDSQMGAVADAARNYTDQKFGQLNQQVRAARQEARQAAAVGLAAASLRFDDRPGKFSAAAGGGVWRGEGALAFGAGYTSENGRVRANLTGATTGGEWGVGAGVSVTLN